jgi:hypothetical protein
VIVYQLVLLYQQKRALMQRWSEFPDEFSQFLKKTADKERVVYHRPGGGFEPRRIINSLAFLTFNKHWIKTV